MAAARKTTTDVEEDVIVANGDSDKATITRISFTVDAQTRKNIRIAAAHADLEVGEWIAKVLAHYADKAVSG